MSPSYHHGYLCSKLVVALSTVPNITVFAELTLQIGEKDYIPDICLYPKREVNLMEKDIIRMKEMPSAVVEILSPTQTVQELMDKFDIYFQAGIQSCWLAAPFAQTVSVYTSDGRARVFHNEDIVDSALQIRLEWKTIFG
ncbi:MAG: Uma2 family endonuclease [Desulfobacterales bacterium]